MGRWPQAAAATATAAPCLARTLSGWPVDKLQGKEPRTSFRKQTWPSGPGLKGSKAWKSRGAWLCSLQGGWGSPPRMAVEDRGATTPGAQRQPAGGTQEWWTWKKPFCPAPLAPPGSLLPWKRAEKKKRLCLKVQWPAGPSVSVGATSSASELGLFSLATLLPEPEPEPCPRGVVLASLFPLGLSA